jgi:hypothetical protein
VLVRQFQHVGRDLALRRFIALRYDMRHEGGWHYNSNQFTQRAEEAMVSYRERYNQVYAWLHDMTPGARGVEEPLGTVSCDCE